MFSKRVINNMLYKNNCRIVCRLPVLFFFLFLFFSFNTAAQSIRYVKPVATGTGNGSSWQNASDDLQLIINQSGAGDTIWVAQGTYLPVRKADSLHIIDSNNCNNAFVLKANVHIYGGFAGTENRLSQRDWENNPTVLSGDIGIPNDSLDNCYHVVISAGDVGTACLDGFTVTKGKTKDDAGRNYYDTIAVNGHSIFMHDGAGIINVYSSPVFRHLNINNNAGKLGGGMHNYSSSPVITNTTITNNYAVHGAGIYNYDTSSPVLRNVIITKNYATNTGGGIANEFGNSLAILENVIISENYAWSGGGIYAEFASPILTNVLITENIAVRGGGIYIHESSPILTNVTISNNIIISNPYNSSDGGGIYAYGSIPIIRNSIIWGNTNYRNMETNIADDTTNGNMKTSIFTYLNCLIGGEPMGNGIISNANPLFVDTATRDYRLQCKSPAIDRGNNFFYIHGNRPDISHIKTDFEGNPRIYNNGIVDMGAYEYQGFRCDLTLSLSEDTTICLKENLDIAVVLGGVPPWEFVYTADNGLNYDTIRNITNTPYILRVSPTQTTKYHFVYFKDSQADSIISDSIQVVVIPFINPLEIKTSTNDTIFCMGDTLRLNVLNADSLGSFLWTGPNGFASIAYNPVIYNVSTVNSGTYIVRNTSLLNCGTDPDTIEIVIDAVISEMEDTLYMCEMEEVTIYSNTTNADFYQWSTGETSENINVSSPGAYSLKAFNQHCSISDSVNVIQIILSDFSIVETGDLCSNNEMKLTAQIDNVSYQWNTGDTSKSIIVTKEGFYSVSAGAGHCTVYEEIEIICSCEIFLPNVFTPVQGKVYLPVIISPINSFSMYIYDRWGNTIFKTDHLVPWDGTKNGKSVSDGVYYCIVSYSCENNPNKTYTTQSSITVMR
jgi:hypothetical protein